MNPKAERLQEKWYSFIRYHCTQGHIDYWMGDCINNPNNDSKNRMQLNTTASFYRLNQNEWISSREFNGHLLANILAYQSDFTAPEIWDNYIRNEPL